MDSLVSVTELKTYLRIDGEEEDALLATLLSSAKAHCEDYLKTVLPEGLPLPVKQAILILAVNFYEQRIGEAIPQVVYTLLSPYRDHHW